MGSSQFRGSGLDPDLNFMYIYIGSTKNFYSSTKVDKPKNVSAKVDDKSFSSTISIKLGSVLSY